MEVDKWLEDLRIRGSRLPHDLGVSQPGSYHVFLYSGYPHGWTIHSSKGCGMWMLLSIANNFGSYESCFGYPTLYGALTFYFNFKGLCREMDRAFVIKIMNG
jgi:hypothetical protein